MSSVLESLGWGPFFDAQLTPSDAGLAPGRAVEDRGPRLLVRFGDRDRLVAVPRRLRDGGAVPVVGDFVLARLPADSGDAVVERVLARRSCLSRNAAGRRVEEQVLAANVDLVIVVQGLDAGPAPRRLERTVAAVWASGAEPAIVLTKADVAPDLASALATAADATPGVPLLAVSSVTGEGIEGVRALVAPGRTAALLGPSGAGKSTLLNALVGEELQPTAPVREEDRRGRHTTSGRRLIAVPGGGAVVDGPGIRELQLWDGAGVERAFEDVAALAAECRFRDCGHEHEPGCAVRAAVEAGALAEERLESWRKLAREARAHDARHATAERARARILSKEIRRFNRERRR